MCAVYAYNLAWLASASFSSYYGIHASGKIKTIRDDGNGIPEYVTLCTTNESNQSQKKIANTYTKWCMEYGGSLLYTLPQSLSLSCFLS